MTAPCLRKYIRINTVMSIFRFLRQGRKWNFNWWKTLTAYERRLFANNSNKTGRNYETEFTLLNRMQINKTSNEFPQVENISRDSKIFFPYKLGYPLVVKQVNTFIRVTFPCFMKLSVKLCFSTSAHSYFTVRRELTLC